MCRGLYLTKVSHPCFWGWETLVTDCQARNTRKLDFAFNSSFTAVNVAKIMCSECNLSIGRIKALMINAYYAQRIIDVFENNPNTQLNHEIVNEIFGFAADAA